MEWPGLPIAQQGTAPPEEHAGWPGEELLLHPSIPAAPVKAAAPADVPKTVATRIPDKLLGTTSQVNDAGQQLFKDDSGSLTPADPDKHILKWNPDKRQYDVFSTKTEQRPAPSAIETLGHGDSLGARLLGLLSPVRMAKNAFEGATEVPQLSKDILTGQAEPGAGAEDKLAGDLQMAIQPGSLAASPARGVAMGSGLTRPRISIPLDPRKLTPEGRAAAAAPTLTGPEALFTDMTDVGLDTPRSFDTENTNYRVASRAAEAIPGASAAVGEHGQNIRSGSGDVLKTVAEQYGGGAPATPAIAGEAAKDSIVDWVQNRSKQVMSEAYDRAEQAMGNEVVDPKSATKSALSSTADVAAQINDRRANAMIPGQSGAVKFVQGALDAPGGLNYQGIKHLRTAMGEMTPDEMVATGINDQERQAIYGGLTQDLQRHILDSSGPDALHSFMKANDVAQQVFGRRSQLAKIVGIKGDAPPETVFNKLLTYASDHTGANIGLLQTARKAMGEDAWNQVASGSVMQLGRDAEGRFSPDRFVTQYGKLSQPAKTTLFKSTYKSTEALDRVNEIAAARQRGNANPAPFFDPNAKIPDLSESLDKIERISSAYHQRITELENTSKTARTAVGAAAMMEVGKAAVTGNVMPALNVLAGMVGGRMLGEWLSKPLTAAEVSKFATAKQAFDLKPSPVTQLIYKHAQNRIGQLLAMGLGPL